TVINVLNSYEQSIEVYLTRSAATIRYRFAARRDFFVVEPFFQRLDSATISHLDDFGSHGEIGCLELAERRPQVQISRAGQGAFAVDATELHCSQHDLCNVR